MCGHFSPPDDEHRRGRASARLPVTTFDARRMPAHETVRVLRDRQPDAAPVLSSGLDLYP